MVPGYELPEALKQILPMVFWKLHFVFAVAVAVVVLVAAVFCCGTVWEFVVWFMLPNI